MKRVLLSGVFMAGLALAGGCLVQEPAPPVGRRQAFLGQPIEPKTLAAFDKFVDRINRSVDLEDIGYGIVSETWRLPKAHLTFRGHKRAMAEMEDRFDRLVDRLDRQTVEGEAAYQKAVHDDERWYNSGYLDQVTVIYFGGHADDQFLALRHVKSHLAWQVEERPQLRGFAWQGFAVFGDGPRVAELHGALWIDAELVAAPEPEVAAQRPEEPEKDEQDALPQEWTNPGLLEMKRQRGLLAAEAKQLEAELRQAEWEREKRESEELEAQWEREADALEAELEAQREREAVCFGSKKPFPTDPGLLLEAAERMFSELTLFYGEPQNIWGIKDLSALHDAVRQARRLRAGQTVTGTMMDADLKSREIELLRQTLAEVRSHWRLTEDGHLERRR